MVSKKVTNKNEPSIVRSSAAEYLTFSEFGENSVIQNFRITAKDGKSYNTQHYNLSVDREILQDSGKVTAEIAKAHAESEFEKYRIIQDRVFESDFDREVKKLLESRKKVGGVYE